LVRRDVAAFTDSPLVVRAESELAIMEAAQIIDLYEKSRAGRVLRRPGETRDQGACDGWPTKSRPRTAAGYHSNSRTAGRSTPWKAWPVLEDSAGFTSQDFAACIDMRISRVEKVLAQKAGRGSRRERCPDTRPPRSRRPAQSKQPKWQKLAIKRAR